MLCKPTSLITDLTKQATDIRRAACIIQTGGLVVFPPRRCTGWVGTPPTPMLPAESMPPRGAPRIIRSSSTWLPRRMRQCTPIRMRCTTGWLKPLCRAPATGHHAAQAHHSPVHDGRTRNRCGPLSVPSRGTCTDRGGGRPDRGAIRQSVRQAVARLRRSRSAGYGRARGHDPGWRRLRDRIGIHHR